MLKVIYNPDQNLMNTFIMNVMIIIKDQIKSFSIVFNSLINTSAIITGDGDSRAITNAQDSSPN